MSEHHRNSKPVDDEKTDQADLSQEGTEPFDEPLAEDKENAVKYDQRDGDQPSQTSELQEEIAGLKDKYLRLYAEFDNYKKRTVREKLDMMRSAAQDTLTSLLPLLDDFDRAKKIADDPATAEKFTEGVELVYQKLYSTLRHMGLSQMESTGKPFDPEQHEAVTEIPAPTPDLKGKVVDTVEKGYFLHDKLIRHAKVVIGR